MRPFVTDVLARLAGADARQRQLAADQVTDWITAYRSEYEEAEAVALALALVSARLGEADPSACEAQLNALAGLTAWHPLPVDALAQLKRLAPLNLTSGEREHLDALMDAQEWHSRDS